MFLLNAVSNFFTTTASNKTSTEASEPIVHIQYPNFGIESNKITIVINDSTKVNLNFTTMLKCIPPIYEFEPTESIGFQWEPFNNPSTLPMSVTWNPDGPMPTLLTESQGPRISYKIIIGDQLFMENPNCNVVCVTDGGSWSKTEQTARISKNEYRADSIRFDYKDGQLFVTSFSYQSN